MFWAVIVASGVAVVSMTLFATWLTRREAPEPHVEEFSPSADPSDPWAAYRPRPFEEMIERPRPRLWPLVTGLTGLVLVGGGIAGARQNASLEAIAPPAPSQAPYFLEVEATAIPTLEPTPAPTPTAATPTSKPLATKAPTTSASKPAATKSPTSTTTTGSPTLSGSAGCSGGMLKTQFSATGTNLSWFAVYIDKEVFKGGPISGSAYSNSAAKSVEPGSHEVEITVDDKAGHRARKLFQVSCG